MIVGTLTTSGGLKLWIDLEQESWQGDQPLARLLDVLDPLDNISPAEGYPGIARLRKAQQWLGGELVIHVDVDKETEEGAVY